MCVGGGLVNATDLKSVVLSGHDKFDSCPTQSWWVARVDKGARLKTECTKVLRRCKSCTHQDNGGRWYEKNRC